MASNLQHSQAEYAAIRARERHNKAYYERDDGFAAMPHTICLSVNNRCAFLCRHCDIGISNLNKDLDLDDLYYSSRYRKQKEYALFPKERIFSLVDEVKGDNPTIKTNFVEPLMYPDLAEVVAYVKGAGLKFYTITNGWLLSKHGAWMVDLGVDLVRVSMDGPAAIHDAIRGRPGSHERCLQGLWDLVREKERQGRENPVLGVCFTVSHYNATQLLPFMEELHASGLLEHVYVNFNHLQYTTDWEVEATRGESAMFGHIRRCSVDEIHFERIDTTSLQAGIAALDQRFPRDRFHWYFSPWLQAGDLVDYYDPSTHLFPGVPCYLPWHAAQVEINGDVGVYGHCILPSFGNLMENSFADVWNSAEARRIRLELKKAGSFTACNKCIGTLYPLRGRD